MYRINVAQQATSGVTHSHSQVITQPHHQQQQQQHLHPPPPQHHQQQQQQIQHQLAVPQTHISLDGGGGGSSAVGGGGSLIGGGNVGSINGNLIISDEIILAAVKAEPIHTDAASTSATMTNGHAIYAPMKRPRLEG